VPRKRAVDNVSVTYTEPLLLIFLICGFAGLLRTRRFLKPRKPVLLATGLAGVSLSCWSPAEWLLAQPLEAWYRDDVPPDGRAEAIVVLSSSVEPPSRFSPVSFPDPSTYRRCRYAAWLYREWQGAPRILVSGGPAGPSRPPVALTMVDLLVAEGVPAGVIKIEDKSRNTYENALYSSNLLKSERVKKIALVVGAESMLRAEWCFRRQGIEVIPAPFGHRVLESNIHTFIPSASALRGNERTLHEILGLAWYKFKGRI
jgi:uncharacterized SAM-binding protein YcdF (DUF218 family)